MFSLSRRQVQNIRFIRFKCIVHTLNSLTMSGCRLILQRANDDTFIMWYSSKFSKTTGDDIPLAYAFTI